MSLAEITIDFLIILIATFTVSTIMYIICMKLKDNTWIDVWWGPSFVLPNIILIALRAKDGQIIDTRVIVTNALLAIWAFRLSGHIIRRH